jgi:hypothetical protein
MQTINTLISIGNSDDKLTQVRWSDFIDEVRSLIDEADADNRINVHGEWFSAPDQPWQNANWCIEIVGDDLSSAPSTETYMRTRADLRRQLQRLALKYEQDSIAWTEGNVEFLPARDEPAADGHG